MNLKEEVTYYDLTAEISASTVVFPGDPIYKAEDVSSISKGAQYHLCHLHLGNHTGTHVDFPAHVLGGGKTSSDYSIDKLIGSCLIIEVPEQDRSISKAFIEKQDIVNVLIRNK